MSKKKVGRVVGSRYLQKTENAPSSKISSRQAHSDLAPASKPLSELKQIPRANSSNIIHPTPKIRNSNEKRPASKIIQSVNKADDSEHEQLSWAYLYQQSRLALNDYQKEQDNILINLAGQVVQLSEELHEKQSIVESDKHLESDVRNLKMALSSITRINKTLDAGFLDHYDKLTDEIGARINRIDLTNAIVYNQRDMENTVHEINGLLDRIALNFGHDLKTCRGALDKLFEEVAHVNTQVSQTAVLLDKVNRAKIKNMGLFNSTEFQSEDSNK